MPGLYALPTHGAQPFLFLSFFLSFSVFISFSSPYSVFITVYFVSRMSERETSKESYYELGFNWTLREKYNRYAENPGS